MAKTTPEPSYAELSRQLEAALAWFESDQLDVDQVAAKYQEVMELISQMEARLKIAKNKITKAGK